MHSTGEFGRGGARRVHACLQLEGTFSDDYPDFLREKARQLSLSLDLRQQEKIVIASLMGSEALIGAFEMSAIIGPQSSTIASWSWLSWRVD